MYEKRLLLTTIKQTIDLAERGVLESYLNTRAAVLSEEFYKEIRNCIDTNGYQGCWKYLEDHQINGCLVGLCEKVLGDL